MADYSERYYNNVRWAKSELKKIADDYDSALKSAEPYKGSSGYDRLVTQAKEQRDSLTAATKAQYSKSFRAIIDGMREKAAARTVNPPSPEQLATVQLLKLRDKVSMEELKAAARTMQNCPLCLSILDEIAHNNDHPGAKFNNTLTTDFVMQHIDSMERNAYSTINGEDHIQGKAPLLRRAPENFEDCICRWGTFSYILGDDRQSTRIDIDTITAFCRIVDGRENT